MSRASGENLISVFREPLGLDSSHLYENRDLAVTTDFPDVFAEILAKRMGLSNLAPVFPGYALDAKERLGLILA